MRTAHRTLCLNPLSDSLPRDIDRVLHACRSMGVHGLLLHLLFPHAGRGNMERTPHVLGGEVDMERITVARFEDP